MTGARSKYRLARILKFGLTEIDDACRGSLTWEPLRITYRWLERGDRRVRVEIGGVAEWSKAAVLKTVVPQGTVGSNPTSSALQV